MSTYPTNGLTGVTPADLGWLTGSWLGKNGNNHVEEHWSQLNGGTLMGMFRWIKGGNVWFYELCAIEQEADHVLMRVKHFFPKLLGWEEKDASYEFLLVQVKHGEAIFYEHLLPDPRWLVYRLHGDNRLVYYFTREDKIDTDTGTFEFTRQ